MTDKRAERKARRCSIDDLLGLWRSYNELDWLSLREILELRPRLRIMLEENRHNGPSLEPREASSHTELAILRKTMGTYTLAAELAGLRAAISAEESSRPTSIAVDFNP